MEMANKTALLSIEERIANLESWRIWWNRQKHSSQQDRIDALKKKICDLEKEREKCPHSH